MRQEIERRERPKPLIERAQPPRIRQYDQRLTRVIRLARKPARIEQRIADVRMKVDARHGATPHASQPRAITAPRGRSGTA
jgi:hypothetical protein